MSERTPGQKQTDLGNGVPLLVLKRGVVGLYEGRKLVKNRTEGRAEGV